jgi:leader peptidase (prepilin peptidase)/N-methyltransferase
MTIAHHAVLAALAFVVGACTGSFLNVCVYRIPRRLSLLRPGSFCPRCRTGIRPRDNIPVLGWLMLRGCCRSCREPISARYPLVEFSTGLLAAGAYCVRCFVAGGDLLEQSGILSITMGLVFDLFLIGAVFTLGLIRYDFRAGRRDVRVERTSGVSL